MHPPKPLLPNHYARLIHLTHHLREPVILSIIAALPYPQDSHGLDAGCGTGLISEMLLDSLGPGGHVTGLDLSPDFAAYAQDMAIVKGKADRLTYRTGDVYHLPFDDHSFDWAWSADCIGYAPFDPMPALGELVRVLIPGGRLSILAWSSENFLPGYPRLEARLKATVPGIAPFAAGRPPESHFLCALGWLQTLGLTAITTQTFTGSVHAPLPVQTRDALQALIEMRWPGVESELDPDDLEIYHRICSSDSPSYILDNPDYMTFFTYTLFTGRTPVRNEP